MKTILVLVPDLFFETRIADAAARLGYRVESLDRNADFPVVLSERQPALVLLSFDRTGDAWERLAASAQAAGVKVVAFGSHMNVGAFKRARELGCADVVANSRLSSELANLLQKWIE